MRLALIAASAAALQAQPRDCFLLSSFSDGVLARPEVGALLRDAVQLQTGSVDARAYAWSMYRRRCTRAAPREPADAGRPAAEGASGRQAEARPR